VRLAIALRSLAAASARSAAFGSFFKRGRLDIFHSVRVIVHETDGLVGRRTTAAVGTGRRRYYIGVVHLALFDRLHAIRGMENVFTDFYEYEPEVRRLLTSLFRSSCEAIPGRPSSP